MNRARLQTWPVPSVVEFVQSVFQASASYSRNSYIDTIRAVNAAAEFAVRHGFRWGKDDFASLDTHFGAMRS